MAASGVNRLALHKAQAKGGGMDSLDSEQKSVAKGNTEYPKGKKKGA